MAATVVQEIGLMFLEGARRNAATLMDHSMRNYRRILSDFPAEMPKPTAILLNIWLDVRLTYPYSRSLFAEVQTALEASGFIALAVTEADCGPDQNPTIKAHRNAFWLWIDFERNLPVPHANTKK
jgi:hypothetical protein